MESAPKYRELAYRVWCENGQHIKKTVAALNKDHNFDITRQSLSNWRDEYGWESRAARAEAAERARDLAISDSVILDSLIEQKMRYDEYFKTLKPGQIDNTAVYGLRGVITTIEDIKDKIAARRREGEKTGQAGISVGRVIKTPQDAVLALEEAIQNKLNIMLAQPDSVSLKSVNELQKALNMLDQMKAQYNPEEKATKGKGLSDAAADELRRKILGIIE